MKKFKEAFKDNFALMKWEKVYLLKVENSNATIAMYNIKIIIFNELNRELYAMIYVNDFEFSFDEFLSEVYEINSGATILLSKENGIDEYLQHLLKLIDRYIYKTIDDLDLDMVSTRIKERRKIASRKYQESAIEKEATKAFKEKRYRDVIKIYKEIKNPNEIQKKRIEMSKKKV